MTMSMIFILLPFVSVVSALDNGLARTPPMGWLSWERYRCNTDCKTYPKSCISENLYKDMADRMAADGYLKAGYQYVNIDDCWARKDRDASGRIVPDPIRFPSGMKSLSKYIHSKGLKLGIYGDFGTHTCAGYPGSIFTMQTDADTFAEWEIDSLKLDGCYADIKFMPEGYKRMGFYLNQTGRPMLYSCSWPAYVVGSGKIPDYAAIAKSCNLWRNYGDISDSWDSVKSIISFYSKDLGNFSRYAAPGSFNDPDMLIVGDYSLSTDQSWAQMVMWAMMASPLYMSNDLRQISTIAKQILLHEGIIKINQDPLGIQGKLIKTYGDVQIWRRPITPHGSFAFAFFDEGQGGDRKLVAVTGKTLGLLNSSGYNVTNIITSEFVQKATSNSTFEISVNPSGVVLYAAYPLNKNNFNDLTQN